MNPPLVSVLMTSWNREKYIEEAIQSVLSSTFTDFELIITDDDSTDQTVAIAREYAAKDARIRVYENGEDLGDYPNRNKAASYALGKYIKYLDSDDVMYPYTLQIMVDYMEMYPKAGFGLSAVHDSKPYPISISPRQAYLEHFFEWGHFNRAPGSAIIRRDAFEKVGGFTGEKLIGDFQLWFRLGREFDMVKIPPNLTWNRVHPGQESQTRDAKLYPLLWKKVIDEALSNSKCPLSSEEVLAIKRKISKDARKRKVSGYLKRLFK